MQKTNIICDCCGKAIDYSDRIGNGIKHTKVKSDRRLVDDYDICGNCQDRIIRYALGEVKLARDCKECNGTKKRRVIDENQCNQSCGENRTEYKTITCDKCF